MRPVLLAARFVLEIALLVGVGVAVWAVPLAALWRVLLVVAAVVAVAAVWGLLLSPRRRVAAPLAVRVVIELALFVAVAAGLAVAGHVAAAVVLVAGEVGVVSALAALGLPPGSDVGAAARDGGSASSSTAPSAR